MNNIIRIAAAGLLVLCFCIGNFTNIYAQDDWKEEYAAVCSRTQNAMSLTLDELKEYIKRCDKLLLIINELDGPQAATEKKIYTRKVKMCRDLYEFALEHREEKE
jgi:hypothetical protein